MTNDIDYKIAVMTAFKNGERVEFTNVHTETWQSSEEPDWAWDCHNYRIAKPEPKKIKLLAFIDDTRCLRWIREDWWCNADYQRVPSEDKEITLP